MKKILTTLFILGFIHPTFANEPQVLKIVPQKTYILLSDHKINSLSMTSNGNIGYSLSSDIYNAKSTLTLWAENEAEATIKLGSNDSEETFKIIANFSNEETLTDSFFALDVVTENAEETILEEKTDTPQLQEKELTEQAPKKMPDKTTKMLNPESTVNPQTPPLQLEETNEMTKMLNPEPTVNPQTPPLQLEETNEMTKMLNPESTVNPQTPPLQLEETNEMTKMLSPEPTANPQTPPLQLRHPTIFDMQQNNVNNLPIESPAAFEGNKK